ncbi:hypothetical protein PV797_16700 [Clostridiaceae bacterium M8S5]|nr:hypothetical protein PV797_16700 [Clostridiaceae bacterium M8S5]
MEQELVKRKFRKKVIFRNIGLLISLGTVIIFAILEYTGVFREPPVYLTVIAGLALFSGFLIMVIPWRCPVCRACLPNRLAGNVHSCPHCGTEFE